MTTIDTSLSNALAGEVANETFGSRMSITELNDIFVNNNYQKKQNEFFENLVNKINQVVLPAWNSLNPLAVFEKGSLDLGLDAEFTHINPAKGFDSGNIVNNGTAQFQTFKADVASQIIRINRTESGEAEVFAVSDFQKRISKAFVSEMAFYEFVNSLVGSLVNGKVDSDFKLTKKVLELALNKNYVNYTEISSGDLVTRDDLENFISQIKEKFLDFQIQSDKNNAFGKFEGSDGKNRIIRSSASDIFLIITNKIYAKVDTKVLAAAFNMSHADFVGRVVTVDCIDEDANIHAVICDRQFLQIITQEYNVDTVKDVLNNKLNTILRANGYFNILGWMNAHFFIDPKATPRIDLTFADFVDTSDINVEDGSDLDLPINLTPRNATTVSRNYPKIVRQAVVYDSNGEFRVYNEYDVSVNDIKNKYIEINNLTPGNVGSNELYAILYNPVNDTDNFSNISGQPFDTNFQNHIQGNIDSVRKITIV